MQLTFFLLGMGIGSIIWGLTGLIDWNNILSKKYRHKAFLKYMDRVELAELKFPVPEQGNNNREVSELTYRDIDNKLCTVKIVIDHSLHDNISEEDRKKYFEAHGEPGPEEFVFTDEAIAIMRSKGLEVDEFVRDVLRKQGKIA